MRQQFDLRRRRNLPRTTPQTFHLEAPPELPRAVEPGILQKIIPWLLGFLILGMIVMMFVMGAGVMRNPMYLMMMGVMVIMAVGAHQNGGRQDMSNAEVDSERAEYLRYLSGCTELIRGDADKQRAAAEWSHPAPETLHTYVANPARMWERGRTESDYLKIRIGLDEVALTSTIKVKPTDSQLDLEPVGHTTLQHLRAIHQSIHHCPKAIDFTGINQISVLGDPEAFAAAVRAWLCQVEVWHSPATAAIAIVSPEHLEHRWGWAKWSLHAETDDVDGAGPARLLFTTMSEAAEALEPMLKEHPTATDDNHTHRSAATGHKHLVIVVDDPRVSTSTLKRFANRQGVTVIALRPGLPDRDYEPAENELMLRIITNDQPRIEEWRNFSWQMFCAEPDFLTTDLARQITRSMARWDTTAAVRQDHATAAAQTLLGLLGIDNAANLDVEKLWTDRPEEEQLRVPLGMQPSGAPLYADLKDEAQGGMGPHGLMIGMTGSGKTTTLRGLLFALFTKHSPDVVRAILADFKGESGVDAFKDYPHVVAVISNMVEKKSLVDRFGETLLGLLDERMRILREAGNKLKGEAFQKLSEYNEARAEGADLDPMPTMFVIVDEFSLLLGDHPEMAETFDRVTRAGRSLGIFFLFASQTLDLGKIKDIDKNTQYRVCLKVASPSISRQIINTEEAFHIESGKDSKGSGYFVRAPGADPVRFRSFFLPERYEPPKTVRRKVITAKPRLRMFTAARVEPDPETVIETIEEAPTTLVGAPRSLILTVGPQLLQAYGGRPQTLWADPLDETIPLDEVLAAAAATEAPGTWWPVGKIDQPRRLRHHLLTYNTDDGNVMILGGPGSGISTALQTFTLSAAARYSPTEVGFYLMSYGSSKLAAIRGLPHVGALGGDDHEELNARIFSNLDGLINARRRLFAKHGLASVEEYRSRRRDRDPDLDDGYPTDVFVVIDGWSKFIKENTDTFHPKNPQIDNVSRLASAGAYGVHVVIGGGNWIEVSQDLQSKIKTHWELKLAPGAMGTVKPLNTGKIIRPQETIPADQPGRGLNSRGETLRFAAGRTDGESTTVGLDKQIRETAAQIAAQYADHRPMPTPQLLPTELPAEKLPQFPAERIALGLRRSDSEPWVVDFAKNPLLAVYGDSGSGKTNLMRLLLQEVSRQRKESEQDVVIIVADQSRNMMDDRREWLIHGHDYYDTDPLTIAARMHELATNNLPARQPPPDLTWEQQESWKLQGPKIYLFIDDADGIPSTLTVNPTLQISPWLELAPFIAKARDIDLRVIMTHKASGAQMEEMMQKSLPGVFKGAPLVNHLLLSSKHTNEKVARTQFEDVGIAGRGTLVSPSAADAGVVQLALCYGHVKSAG